MWWTLRFFMSTRIVAVSALLRLRRDNQHPRIHQRMLWTTARQRRSFCPSFYMLMTARADFNWSTYRQGKRGQPFIQFPVSPAHSYLQTFVPWMRQQWRNGKQSERRKRGTFWDKLECMLETPERIRKFWIDEENVHWSNSFSLK